MANHPIFAPTFHGDLAKVRRMLKQDSDLVRVRDAKNLTPLHVAASRGKEKVAQVLIDAGADVEGPTDPEQWTPLVYAAYRGHLEAVRVLIANGAGVAEVDGNSIHFAGQRKHKEICQLLVANGAVDDLVETNDPAVRLLFRAAYSYDSETVDAVLSERPELANTVDRNGRTPLHEASTNGDTKTVRVLLEHGCNPAAIDNNGQTPLDRARAHKQQSVIKRLEKHLAR